MTGSESYVPLHLGHPCTIPGPGKTVREWGGDERRNRLQMRIWRGGVPPEAVDLRGELRPEVGRGETTGMTVGSALANERVGLMVAHCGTVADVPDAILRQVRARGLCSGACRNGRGIGLSAEGIECSYGIRANVLTVSEGMPGKRSCGAGVKNRVVIFDVVQQRDVRGTHECIRFRRRRFLCLPRSEQRKRPSGREYYTKPGSRTQEVLREYVTSPGARTRC